MENQVASGECLDKGARGVGRRPVDMRVGDHPDDSLLTASIIAFGEIHAAVDFYQLLFEFPVALVLFGGVVGDRFRRRSVMIGADLLRFAAQAFLALQLISGNAEFWQILAVQLLHGAGSAFFLPALSGLIPQTVSSERLAGANALRGLALASAAMIGPALAGILTAASGVGWAFAADAASFLLSAAFLARVRVEQEAPSAAERSAIRELLEGWAEFRRRTWLWAVVVEFALLNALVFAPFQVLATTLVAALPSVRQLRSVQFRAPPSPAPAFSSPGGLR